MLQLAVCDDEAVCLRQTVDILRAALGDTPHQLKTFQNAPAMLAMLAEVKPLSAIFQTKLFSCSKSPVPVQKKPFLFIMLLLLKNRSSVAVSKFRSVIWKPRERKHKEPHLLQMPNLPLPL